MKMVAIIQLVAALVMLVAIVGFVLIMVPALLETHGLQFNWLGLRVQFVDSQYPWIKGVFIALAWAGLIVAGAIDVVPVVRAARKRRKAI